MNSKFLLALPIAALVAACQPAAVDTAPQITDAWARETVEGQMMAAAYFTISNPSDATVRVVGVETPAATSASFHRSMVENGVATMRALEGGLVVEAGENAVLEPGGDHVMLEGLKAPLVEGSSVELVLTYETGETQNVDVDIVGAGER